MVGDSGRLVVMDDTVVDSEGINVVIVKVGLIVVMDGVIVV